MTTGFNRTLLCLPIDCYQAESWAIASTPLEVIEARPVSVTLNDDTVPQFAELYKNMGSLSVPVQSGDIYWIQVSTHRITEFNYVAVTYH